MIHDPGNVARMVLSYLEHHLDPVPDWLSVDASHEDVLIRFAWGPDGSSGGQIPVGYDDLDYLAEIGIGVPDVVVGLMDRKLVRDDI